MERNPTRRRFAELVGAGSVAALAGCGGSDGSESGDDSGRPGESDATGTATESAQSDAPLFEQTAKMIDSDGDPDDRLGWSTSITPSGGTAVVGAFYDDTHGSESGSAYVFSRSNGSWAQQAKLTADDEGTAYKFGFSVSVTDDGTTALIGAPEGRNADGERSGTAYVFSRSDGSWSQQTKLVANDSEYEDAFGGAVSIAGDGSTAIVGADNTDSPDIDGAGTAYVFSRSGESWNQHAKLQPENVANFGISIGMSTDGTVALIGADSDGGTDEASGGWAVVFSRSGDSWTQQTKLSVDDGGEGEGFGHVVDLSADGTTAIVTDQGNDTVGVEGAAYLFTETNGSWERDAKFVPDDGDSNYLFGSSAGISGDGTTAMVGSPFKDEYTGAAYVYSDGTDGWNQRTTLTSDEEEEGDLFAASIALSTDASTAVIGCAGEKGPDGDDGGAAYAFESTR